MFILILFLWLLTTTPAAPEGRLSGNVGPQWGAASCGDPCVVKNSPGGNIDMFIRAARGFNADGRTLMIDGRCASACTIAADYARRRACITPNAVMSFHKGYTVRFGRVIRINIINEYSADIAAWITSQGGLPGRTVSDNTMLDMPFETARRFWRVCDNTRKS